jgi:hypothetical protein
MQGFNGFSLEELRFIDYRNHYDKKINLMDYIEKNERRNKTYGSNDGKRTPFGRSNTSYGGFGTR